VKPHRWGLVLLSLLAACGPRKPGPTNHGRVEGAVGFAFGTTQGEELSSETTRGRATALIFVTTYDPVCQAQATELDKAVRSHTPRSNAGAVVMEAPKYAFLAEVWRTELGLSYPVAMANPSTLGRSGPFGSLRRVPTLVVLDRSGREVWRREGFVALATILHQLSEASKSGDPRGY